mmetsp:Transcript_96563/g.288242  ORF Transcript_96563/g.288242 Transcript_96563/m.288242 type:complete len:341 (-) Transcript_96563:569-1591(-)
MPLHRWGGCALRPAQPPHRLFAILLYQVALLCTWACLDKYRQWKPLDKLLHHCQMLKTLMRAEEEVACVQFNQDAPQGPDVGALVPSALEDNLRASILPGADGAGMVVMLGRRIPKIDQLDPGIHGAKVGRGRNARKALRVLPESLAREVARSRRLHGLQEDILGLHVCMGHPQRVVQERQRYQALGREALEVLKPEAPVGILLQGGVQGRPQGLADQAEEPVFVDEGPIQDAASPQPLRICPSEVPQYVGLDPRVLPVPLHITDDLDCHRAVRPLVPCEHHPAECSVPEQADELVPGVQQRPPLPREVSSDSTTLSAARYCSRLMQLASRTRGAGRRPC